MVRVISLLSIISFIILGSVGSSHAQSSPGQEGSSVGRASLNSKAADLVKSDSAAPRSVSKAARENARQSYKGGINYERGGLFRQAMESFQQAISYDPEFAEAYVGLGASYLGLGRVEEAITTLEKALSLNPHLTEAYTRLGQAYTKQKELKAQASKNSRELAANSAEANSGKKPEPNEVKDPTQVYNVGVGDVIDIRLPGSVSSESTLYVVSSSGHLEHPILNQPIKVLGLTTDQIAAQFAAELKRRSMGVSNVDVTVRDYNSHTILVSGLVKEPGAKILRREAIPLYVVLADAQPLNDAAIADVLSKDPTHNRSVELADSEQTASLVRPGDVVRVRAAVKRFFYIGGNVKLPGELQYRAGLTLTQAILSAGGTILKADKIQLTRGQGNGLLKMQEFKLKEINSGKTPDPLIEPGDRITIL